MNITVKGKVAFEEALVTMIRGGTLAEALGNNLLEYLRNAPEGEIDLQVNTTMDGYLVSMEWEA